jgi:hypothetical protein
MTFTPAFEVGHMVWHAQTAYRCKVQAIIAEIRIHYDEDGNLTASYLFRKYEEEGRLNYWFAEKVLFKRLSDLEDSLNEVV